MGLRIVVLTYESHQANHITQHLLQQFPDQVVGLVQSDVIVAGKSTWQSLWFLLRRTGLGFVLRKGIEIVLSRFVALLAELRGRPLPTPSLQALSRSYRLPLLRAKNVNAAAIRRKIAAWQPDLIISVYFNQRIWPKLIDLPTIGVINIHPALLPRNRGLFPYFWALANGDSESGVTVHWVDPQFDTGAILVQQALPITTQDTVISLARRSAEIGAELLVEAVRLIEAGNPPQQAQNATAASYFSWPTPADLRRFRARGRRYGSWREFWRDLQR